MALVRRIQKKGSVLNINIPTLLVQEMGLRKGDHMLIHEINYRQIVLTKVEEDLPVIQLEKGDL